MSIFWEDLILDILASHKNWFLSQSFRWQYEPRKMIWGGWRLEVSVRSLLSCFPSLTGTALLESTVISHAREEKWLSPAVWSSYLSCRDGDLFGNKAYTLAQLSPGFEKGNVVTSWLGSSKKWVGSWAVSRWLDGGIIIRYRCVLARSNSRFYIHRGVHDVLHSSIGDKVKLVAPLLYVRRFFPLSYIYIYIYIKQLVSKVTNKFGIRL